LVDADLKLLSWPGNSTYGSTGSYAYRTDDGNKYNNGSGSSYGSTVATGDVIGIAYDGDNGALYFSKNGTWQNSGDPTSGASATGAAFTGLGNQTWTIACGNAGGSTNGTATNFNFGQRAFAYTPPTGYKALNTANLPAPDIADGSQYFDILTWTGDSSGASRTLSGLAFGPDLVWAKGRNQAISHQLTDIVRGAGATSLRTDDQRVEGADGTSAGYLSAFTSDGFETTSSSTNVYYNTNTYTYAAWCWDAGGSGSSNTDGTITSTVSANPTAGFSIVTWNGSAANGTVGHGLGVAPSLIIFKRRNAVTSWPVYHSAISPSNVVYLNETSAQASSGNSFGSTPTAPTNTVFSVGDKGDTNYGDMLAYCFSEVAGYSKFGNYAGNSSTDGVFVYTGFRPAFVMCKNTQGGSWFMHDTTRMPYNPAPNELLANSSLAEGSSYPLDILSNGFKWRSASGEVNTGPLYIFAAFAEHPFGGSGVSPATAR
jgi:hypothetical protein